MLGSLWQRIRNARKNRKSRYASPKNRTRLVLEPLEDRVLLSGVNDPVIAANTLVGDMEQVRNDVVTAPYILLNAVQQSSTTQVPSAAVATQWNII